jgi:hypothetical protein
MKTLVVAREIERSLVGSAIFSPRFQQVGIGKLAPAINSPEDAESIVRCHFLDPGLPFEVNLVCAKSMRVRLDLQRFDITGVSAQLSADRLLPTHPTVGYVPPELVSFPNSLGLGRLSGSSPSGEAVAKARLVSDRRHAKEIDWGKLRRKAMVGESAFWTRMESEPDLYQNWIKELATTATKVIGSLIAPPVPSLSTRFRMSPQTQNEFNLKSADILAQSRRAGRGPGALYSLHIHPSAIRNAPILKEAIQLFDHSVTVDDTRFWGVHVHFYDLSVLSRAPASARAAAREVVADVSKIARGKGLFTWVSNVGIPGQIMLDEGAAFGSYPPNGNPRRVYPLYDSSSPEAEGTEPLSEDEQESRLEARYGKIINGPHRLTLLDYRDLRARNWLVQDNGKTPRQVPPALRDGPYRQFRVEFAKVNNVACMERLNELREHDLTVNGNARPGRDIVKGSEDGATCCWA